MKSDIRKFLDCTGNSPVDIDCDNVKGKLKAAMLKRIDLQLEELNEKKEALENDDWVKVLDGVFDNDVYQHQDIIDLEAVGFNYRGACKEGCINNSLKYTTSKEYAENWLHELQEKTGKDDWYISANTVWGETFYCLKNRVTHKVSKYWDFPEADFRPFVPEKFKDE